MIKRIIRFLLIFTLFFSFLLPVNAKEKVTLYLFHGDGCPHCAEEIKFLKKMSKKYDFNIVKYEVWYNADNSALLDLVGEKMEVSTNGVPLTVIGNSYFVGFNDSIGSTIERAISYYLDHDYVDQIERIKNDEFENDYVDEFSLEEENLNTKYMVKVPLFGKVNVKDLSIYSAAVIIGLIDGFNPCAMWVLLFLISLLIGMKNKRRMWVLGLSFLITSALVYMLIMFSWLNIVVKISTSTIIRYIIGVVAIIGGIVNLYSFYKSNDSGCTVVDDKKRKKIFSSIKKFTSERSFALALLGVIGLAISVNMVELACSAGLPLIFTQLLAINNVSGFMGFIYTLVYVFFFLLDDLVIFFIAMFTMKVTGISTKYNKYSHLIGGLIMLLIGILLIFKYKLLTFGF